MALERRDNSDRASNNTGVFLGKVVSHLDTTYMGGVQVEILKNNESGSITGQTVNCKYASPFYGQSPYSGLGRGTDYASTQKSYGFWAVPPDIGTQVIVVMPEGNYSSAYWIGCVPDTGMNFMTPGNAGTTFNNADQSAALPVGEFNKLTTQLNGSDPTKATKPAIDSDRFTRYNETGLIKDHIRGSNTSSARREVPSKVFGISTPGPEDIQGPKHQYGPTPATSIQRPYNRLGGSSFVMDDGDMTLFRKKPAADGPLEYANAEKGDQSGDPTLPANDLIRLQTRTGHQILMHNTEDLIYISHGSGNSWIEMTANGKIEIYSKDSISVNTENDINFNAGRDINFAAKEDINFVADKNIKMHSLETTTHHALNYKMHVEENSDIRIDKESFTYVEQDKHLVVKGNKLVFVEGSAETEVSSDVKMTQRNFDIKTQQDINFSADAGSISLTAQQNIAGTATATVGFEGQNVGLSGRSTAAISAGFIGLNGTVHAPDPVPGNTTVSMPAVEGARAVVTSADEAAEFEGEEFACYPKRIPQHEPWKEHENLNPGSYVPDETRSTENERPEPDDSPFEFPPQDDTFAKGQ
jgi:phage baseplate assembly protein gpV